MYIPERRKRGATMIKKLLFLAILGTGLLVHGALASTLSQICTPVQPTTTPIPYQDDCTISAFNTSLGTLQSVTLQITGVGGTVIPEQSNNSAGALTFTNSVATIDLSFAELGSLTELVDVSQISSACAGTVAANSTNTTCASTPFSSLSSASEADTNLSFYETGGLVTLVGNGELFSASGNGGVGSAGHIFFGGDGTIGGELTVTYNFTSGSAPEPATMAMAGGLLLGLAALARKRRA